MNKMDNVIFGISAMIIGTIIIFIATLLNNTQGERSQEVVSPIPAKDFTKVSSEDKRE
jgi:hypothetical protein